MATIKFDLGIYSFRQTIYGAICHDDSKLRNGDIIGVLHPLQTVDEKNIYCYGVDKLGVHQLVRNNLRFKKVLTLSCSLDKEHEIELHAKLNAVYHFLCDETKQLHLQG